jgi:hypothetical protein
VRLSLKGKSIPYVTAILINIFNTKMVVNKKPTITVGLKKIIKK